MALMSTMKNVIESNIDNEYMRTIDTAELIN
jgi:hypothetical protein